jgi:hypothetical protein
VNYILFVFLFSLAGPHAEYRPFHSLAECEIEARTLPATIAKHNAEADDHQRVLAVSATCAPVLQVKPGVRL